MKSEDAGGEAFSPQVTELGARGRGVLVHGGAGDVPAVSRARHVEGCIRAARIAHEALAAGASALDAAELAVRTMEDDPVFNAGTGACLNAEGHLELDASIMEGRSLRAGAVCALRGFASPVAIARAALEDGRHVLYAAEGARAFALERGFAEVDELRMVTDAARAALARARRTGGVASGWAGGTVGAVAIDASGSVAAATSTGGTNAKRPGRVGDSPLIGAGTYADDEAGAVSTTGHGEGMIRLVVAKSVVDALARGALPGEAVRDAIERLHARVGSRGGAIAVRRDGAFGFARSTATMSWALCSDSDDPSGI